MLSASHNPRSTVGTVTEVYDYLRLLYARVGHPHCPNCGREIARQSVEQIVDDVMAMPPESRILVLGPVVRGRKGEYRHVFEDARRAGYVRVEWMVRCGTWEEASASTNTSNTTSRLSSIGWLLPTSDADEETRQADRSRLADSVETALKLGDGIVLIQTMDG